MKKAAASLLVTFLAATAHAGSFGGPPPFTNGSPLSSGNDGLYAASAHGKNLSGIIRFALSGGAQTTSTVDNSYYVFVAGQVYSGDVQATLGEGTVAGILDESFTNNGNSASGYFSGGINQNSSYGSFSGKGKVTIVNGTSTTSTTGIIERTTTFTSGGVTTDTSSTTTNSTNSANFNIATEVKFNYSGVRTVVTGS